MNLRALLVCITVAGAGLPVPAHAARAALFGFGDLPKLVSVSGVEISPNGKQIAFTTSRPDTKKNEYARELDLADVATGKVRALTHDRPHVSDPQWAPDGSKLAFLDVVDKKPQVFVLPMDGGEAQAVTSAPNGVDSYAWRPDGAAIAYVSENDAPDKSAIAHHHDIFRVGDNDFLATSAPVPSHLWLQRVQDGGPAGKAERLTNGTWSAGGGLSWSADGSEIAFTRMPDAYSGHFGEARAAELDVKTRHVSEITQSQSGNPQFAPHGDAIAYSAGKDGLWAFYNTVMLQKGSNAARIAPSVDRDWSSPAWTFDGGLVLGTFEGPRMGLWRISPSGAASPIALGDVDAIDASAAHDGGLAFSGSTPQDPSEVYYLPPGGTSARRMTDFNAFLASENLGATTELRWRNDGFAEDGIVTYPPEFTRARKYPLVLVIHGGPTGNGSTVAFDPLAQMLAAHGFIVLQPNYRGSDNLGFAYAKATRGDVDKGAGTDVVAGVRAIEAEGIVDPQRIGVSGWSAGGLMTSWLIGNYDLWKAAVTGAGVDDFVEEYDNEDSFDYMPALMGGASPWKGDGMALYRAHSPITYAKNVKAATLILSDTSDYRVPTVQSYELYHALRGNGANVEFDAIPAYGHFPSDPIQRFDVYRRWTNWFVTHL